MFYKKNNMLDMSKHYLDRAISVLDPIKDEEQLNKLKNIFR